MNPNESVAVERGFWVWRSSLLSRVPGVAHGVVGRNAGGGADEAEVGSVVAPGSAPERIAVIRQIHGDGVLFVGPGDEAPDGEEADGLVTTAVGTALRVRVADCMPVFLCDRATGVLALVHAGWRGLACGVVERALERAVAAGARPHDTMAAVGPSIGPCCYEVGPEVPAAFGPRARVEAPYGGRPRFDLYAVARDTLLAAGIPRANVDARPPCTRCGGDRWHSHRGSAGAPGRNIAYLAWTMHESPSRGFETPCEMRLWTSRPRRRS